MISTLRVFSLLIGLALAALLPFMIYAFAAGVGDLDEMDSGAFLMPLAVGFLLGCGPIAAGLPNFLEGARKPRIRVVGGIFLCISSATLLIASFVVPPLLAAIVFNVLLFFVFVWPAKQFPIANPSINPDAAR